MRGDTTDATTAAASLKRKGVGTGVAAKGGSFRQFMAARNPEAAKRYVPPETPTPERIAKGDQPYKAAAGFYRAPPPIERLHNRKMLDKDPDISRAMLEASTKLAVHFVQGGLSGIKAQDLSRAVGSGDGGACQFPRTDHAMYHRTQFREACDLMGWYPDAPFRGAGRLVVDVVCFEMAVADAARIHIGHGRTEAVVASGMDRLREGLFALASHWNMFRRSARNG